MNRKTYKLLSGTKQMLFAFALALFLSTAHSQTTYTFNYTGSTQTLNVQAGTNYTIEMWGANGGDNLGNGSSTYFQNGGKGGYSIGTYSATSSGVLYITPGGRGSNSTSTLNVTTAGGYNGGGYGSANTASGKSSGAAGGGATHVATLTGVLSALSTSQAAVRIVAGGGGGAGESNYGTTDSQYNSNGGNGGGASGLQVVSTGYQGRHGQGGTQTAGGGGGDNASATAGVPLQGIFGDGGYNTTSNGNTNPGGSGGGGGGGGWYGGGAGWVGATSYCAGSGGGGSGYIGGVTNGTTLVSGTSGFVTNPDLTGNGMVRIIESCNIALTATGLSAGNSLCSGNSVTLTTNAVGNYSWSTGATTQSIVVFPTSSGMYTATGTSTSSCNAITTISITVNGAAPSLSIANSATSSICLGKTATLTASGALSYTWTGTSSPTPTNGLSFFPSNTSTYIVTGTNACGTTTAATSISIAPLLVAAATTSSLVCAGKNATLSAFSAVSGYTWQPGGQPSSSYIIAPLVNTIYTVTASDGTCVGTATVGVNTNPNPTINVVTTSTNICIGAAVSLTASGSSSSNNYTWTSVPATTTITGQSSVSPSFPNPGAYAFYATGDNNFGCQTTNVQIIIVNAAPVLVASANKTLVCSGGASTLNITGGDVYQWDSNANNATTQTVVVNPTNTSTYIVTSTLNATQCPATTSVVVLIYSPTITISSPTSACLGVAVTLTGSVNNPSSGSTNSYTWTGPGLPNTVGSNINVTPNGLTVYTLTARSTTGGNLSCTQTKTTSVGIAPNPVINVAPSRTYVCKGEPVDLIASGAITYSWNGNSLTGTTITVTHTNIATIPYSVTGTDANGCKNDTIYYLKINGCQGIQEFENNSGISVYPNPNNGEFYIVADKALKLQLINELGQIIKNFELNAANQHKIQTADIAKGIYFIVDEKKAIAPQKIIVK